MGAAEGMPDLSHLSEEERQIILQVLQRQKAEEQQEEEIAQKGDKELWDIERQIQERTENAQRLIGTQDDAICQICQKTKFADGIGHKCFYCQLRSCARCGGKTTSKSKNIWACSLCQKRQQILAKTGKWFQQPQKEQLQSGASPGQMSQSVNSNASPVEPTSPGPMAGQRPAAEEEEPRRPSLQQQQQATPSALHRQGTLHRQRSLEEPQQQQQPTMNGERVAPAQGQGRQAQTPRTNGQMRKTSSSHQPREGPVELARQKSIRQAQMGRQQSAPQQPQAASQSARLAPSEELSPQALGHQKRPSTAGRIRPADSSAAGGQRQRSTEEGAAIVGGHPRQSQAAAEHRRLPPTASAPFVPAVPGQRPPSSARQSSASSALPQTGPSPMRVRRSKMAANRQQPPRSYSSSDDELSSPKQQQQQPSSQQSAPAGLPQSSSLQLGTADSKLEPDFSEKELLRYIYDNAHPNARRATASARGGPFFGQSQQAQSLDAAAPSAMSSPAVHQQSASSAPSPSNALARRIRNYLSNPAVSWQPSADQRRLIGHVVLYKPSSLALMNLPNSSAAFAQGFSSLDFGLKVVGGRNPASGRFGAFVSRVRPGSVADTVGQLRAGDEVLEWNGHSLQNVTPEGVYNIVQSTKGDSRLELIVSRPIAGGDDDFLNLRRLRDQQAGGIGQQLAHSQSMTAAPSPFGAGTPQQRFHSRRAPSPLVLHAAGASLGSYFDPMPLHAPPAAFPSDANDPRICGRLEMALLYLAQKRELIVSLSRAFDLVPRPDRNARNPYVKLFLLPDRSERSRRQSKVLSETLSPVWEEHFFYEELDEASLSGRVLEVTLWDYDPYESHSFLGETLVELGQAALNNQPFLYNLLDMDEENPIRMRLRQRRYSSMTPPVGQRSRSHLGYSSQQAEASRNFDGRKISGNSGNSFHSAQNLPHSRNRTTGGFGPNGGGFPLAIGGEEFWQTAEAEDWNRNEAEEEWPLGAWGRRAGGGGGGGGRVPNGYLSDQEQEWELDRRRRERGEQHPRREHRHQHNHRGEHRGTRSNERRPQSATALRNIADWELRHSGGDFEGEGQQSQRIGTASSRKTTRQQELREREAGGGGGYGSDGSVETLSVNSAQSMQNRALIRQQQIQRIRDQQQISQSSNEENEPRGQLVVEDEEEVLGSERMMGGHREGGLAKGQGALSAKEMKERKKSLMTRLIPGRNGPNDASKRLGFARSEEVGIPSEGGAAALAPPEQNRDFIKQNSKESTDSSDNWLPIVPDRPLGSFVENLGPGQVVGRQALGSSPLGELHVGLAVEPGTGLVVDVKEARGLKTQKQQNGVPVTYVKAYLMDKKSCVAKAKTQPSKSRSASPSFRQKLVFAENPRHKMLQLTVIGDFGRMERKSFMGVAQVALDELQLGREPLDGWYKLFHSASLNGSAQPPGTAGAGGSGGPSRKDSEVSLN